MRIGARLRRTTLVVATVSAVVAPLALSSGPAAAATPGWQEAVAQVPTAPYTRDAQAYIREATAALRPHVGEDLGESRLEPVLADVDTRYFDGARLRDAANGEAAFDNLEHLESYLKGRVSGGDSPSGEAGKAYVAALAGTLTGVRLLADAAIQDAQATIGPWRSEHPPATPPPAGVEEGFRDLDDARTDLAQADEMLVKANPEPAAVHNESAWRHGFTVLSRLGITYDGDHDADGVVDVVELRFGSSPLLIDSDGDGLTDNFEINKLAGFTLPGRYDTDGDGVPDGAEDVDGDGLTNLREQELGTSPTEADTDGDGISDGAEVARGTNPLVPDAPPPPVTGGAPPIVPAPDVTDTDGDGLTDVAEDEILTDKNNVDSDADGLSDGTEINDWGINPLNPDTDGDSLRDDYESVHVDDQGLDPGRPDQQISKWTYVTDFALGLIAGDFAPRDSMAWLAGNLCSGALSFIPVVGWIAGAITDIRDTIAGLIQGDWVGAGLSILGVVPYVGDAVAIPGKAARFVLRYLHRLDETLRFVTRYDKIPDSVKDLALELILGGTYAYLQGGDQTLSFATFAALAAAGSRFSVDDIRRLSRGDRTKWKSIEEAMKLPNHKPGVPVAAQRNAPAGEAALASILQNCAPQHLVLTTGYPSARSKHRKADCAETDPATGEVTLHEVKTGVPTWTESLIDECLKDAWIPTNEGKAVHGQNNIKKVHWHFFAHSGFNSIGIHPPLLECLKNNNIDFTIHAPSA